MHVNSQDSFLVLSQCDLHSHTGIDVIWIFYTQGRRSHNTAKYAIINDSYPIRRVSMVELDDFRFVYTPPPRATTRRRSEGSHRQSRTLDSAPLDYIPLQGRRNRSGCSGFGRTNILSSNNIFSKKTKKNTYRNVDLYRYRSSRAEAVKRHFDGFLMLIKSLRYSGYYVTCKMVERRSEQEFSLARCTRAT